MAIGGRVRRQGSVLGRSVNPTAFQRTSIGMPANTWHGSDRAELSEDVAAYSVSLESVFGHLRRLLIQIGGLLVLQGGSTRTQLEMGAFWESTSDALKKLRTEVAEIRAPRGFEGHHGKIVGAVNDLEHIHTEAFTARTSRLSDESMMSALHSRLTNVLGVLRSSELRATGATLIDFHQSCCCPPGDMQCSHC